MSKDIGGPAFPVSAPNYTQFGMTLRDYFAAKALLGLIAEPVPRDRDGETTVTTMLRHAGATVSTPAHAFALCAYALADAMLAERAK